ncbi:MAG: DUF2029 domain-containing protein [Thermoleophilaceae bacterium]|nr:DUF2029 domain-containing protein [Thermoleophilaceae bacterium]
MSHRTFQIVLGAVLVAVATKISLDASVGLDYESDAQPAIDALAEGRFGDFLSLQPLMGSFSILVRAPLAALAGGDEALRYGLGVLPCLLAAGALGLALARAMGERGLSRPAQAVTAVICVVNPLTLDAIQLGHPEEILGAALSVGAVLAAIRKQVLAAALLLGLAVATKQWAVLVILPVIIAAPAGRRVKLAVIAGALTAILTLPLALGNSESFGRNVTLAGNTWTEVRAASAWWPVAERVPRRVFDGVDHTILDERRLPLIVGRISHPLIVLLGAALALLWWRRKGDPADALALLALVMLLRAILDPVNASYYLVPFLLSLAGWEALAARRVPVATVIATACSFFTFDRIAGGAPDLANVVLLLWSVAFAIYLALVLYAPGTVRSLGKLLSTSEPSSVTTTRSSIRTPSFPGR